MYYKRTLEPQIASNLDNRKVLILTGMRRTGKTTLLRKIFTNLPGNKLWFDFENPLHIKYFEDIDYDDVYQNIINLGVNKNKRIYVFIDEVQNYPVISKVVKYLIDHYNVKFIFTGSASYYLKNLFPESLAGRKVIFHLFPLDFREFLCFKGEDIPGYNKIKSQKVIKEVEYEKFDKYYEEYIEYGGFPEVVLEDRMQIKEQMLNDIFSSYWQKEIIALADYHKNLKVRDLMLLLSARVGSRLDLVKLSQELQISRTTVYNYMAFLEATYFIHLINPFSNSVDREVSGTPKIYFCDNGILRIMARLNFGQILENAVFNQLKHKGWVNYYQRRTGAEIDFIVDRKTAYEVKATASPTDIRQLEKGMRLIKIKKGYVVSKNYTGSLDRVLYGQFL